MTRLIFPDGLNEARFLHRYWQSRPLLMRAALPGLAAPLSAEELAGLACEAGVEARIVLEHGPQRPWEVHHGPFRTRDFAALPDSHWSLLVQDVDKYVPEAARLLAPFRFIPDWRVDDVMVSVAPDQGSVGPHVDAYDVFLIQVSGRRRWQIQDRPAPPAPCIPDLDLQILEDFNPDREWVVEPGDVLYLPPGIAHWGLALGQSMTCSVGFRAPTDRELLSAWCEQLLEGTAPEGRYADPGLRPQEFSAEILPETLRQVHGRITQLVQQGLSGDESWFGRLLTETKADLEVLPAERPSPVADFLEDYEEAGVIERHPWTRLAFLRGGGSAPARLFANGHSYPVPARHWRFVAALTASRTLQHTRLAPALGDPHCARLLTDLYNDGHFTFPEA